MLQEQLIVDSFQQGRLELFYDRVYPGLLSYAKRILQPEREMYAEDCVQNAVYKVWKKQENLSIDLPSLISLKIYFYMTIRNEVLNIRRKESYHTKYIGQLEEPVVFRNSIIENEVRTSLFEAVRTLPEKERKVVVMSFFNGMTNSEIAGEMGISLASVKRYKGKGVELLRKKLDPVLFAILMLMH